MRWLAILALAACSEPPRDLCGEACGAGAHCDPVQQSCYCDRGTLGDPLGECVPHGDLCAEAATRVGHRVCVHEIDDVETWNGTTLPYFKRDDVRRVSKYLIPAVPEAPIPTVFSDTNHYRVHFCMLKEAFEPQFPGIVFADYHPMTFARATRTLYAGSVYELIGDDLPTPYGFIVESFERDDELLYEDEVAYVHRTLQDRFGLGELAYIPATPQQQEKAAAWEDPPFRVVVGGSNDVTFESYAPGVAYGRVRRYPAAAVDDASGTFGWQDIVVLETTTNVLEGVNAGVITGSRQDLLSHLNVLAAQRGTPNAFVADPLDAFEPFDGALVRLDVTDQSYTIAFAAPEEAEAFWAMHRPRADIADPPDRDYTDLPGVLEIPVATAPERATAVSRVGGKATGLATLFSIIEPRYQIPAFAIPVAYGLQFMEDNGYAQRLEAWLADPEFRTNPAIRRERLDSLASEIKNWGVVDPTLVTVLEDRIREVFGEGVMVRFRSSSNTEDGVDFNGAGLYESESVCVGDTLTDTVSRCDPESQARPLELALRKVWASLWSFGAFEERDYYQLDHTMTAMGVAVTLRFAGEQANGVIFTGNPLDPEDDRFTINVQRGETDVVNSDPGTTAELDRLKLEDGVVVGVERVALSSLPPYDEPVLSDTQLHELGAVVAAVQDAYPELPEGVLLDIEFKIDAAGQLKLKQLRPFRPSAVTASIDNCALE